MNDQTTNASETDLFVDVDNLAEDGNTLITQANAINDNIIAIRKMLGDGWSSWLGEDKEEYVKSLKKDLLMNLDTFCAEVNKCGEYMNKHYKRYAEEIKIALEGLKEYE